MPRLLADLEGPLEAELDQVASEVGSRYATSSSRTAAPWRSVASLTAGGLVASAMPLCDTCAVRPPSMTSSAPL